jgi:mannosyltransferase OCH1-like enzyme
MHINIEKKLSHIWIGPKPAPLKWMYTWRDKHPDWEYSIFDDAMLKRRRWINQDLIEHYYRAKAYCGVSDLIRYELLYEQGGFIAEADMICLNETTELFTSPADHAYTCFENDKGQKHVHNFIQPIFACNPGNEFVKMLIDSLRLLRPGDLHRQPHKSTGNEFLAQFVDKWRHKLTIWPSHYFIPQYYLNQSSRYDGPDKIYADHKWGSTGMGYHCADYSQGV